MITFLKGTCAGFGTESVYLDVQGVGFEVFMCVTDRGRMQCGEEYTVLTHMSVREDDMQLYGFLSQDARVMFTRLIGVSGVGPKAAMSALSTFSPESLVSAIAAQDDKSIATIPGVGKKTAQRIILELKGSIDASASGQADLFASSGNQAAALVASAQEALLSMGFTSAEAQLALKGAPETATTEGALLQYALKRLGSSAL